MPAGDIYLTLGRHFGPNRGFGANHIWVDHLQEIAKYHGLSHVSHDDERGLKLVAGYVAAIIQPGTPVYCEFAHIKTNRPTILSSKIGTVILEQRTINDENVYSVVTAFDLRQPRGTLIGRVS